MIPSAREHKDLFEKYDSAPVGLTFREAKYRHQKFGLNVITESTRKNILHLFISKFSNPLILILLGAAGVSAYLQEIVDFAVIFLMILVSVVIETYQEHQSGEAAEKLKKKVAVKARVLRDGEIKHVHLQNVTVGDVVLLETGDIVPADCIVFEHKDLHVDESSFTGETFPAEKKEGDGLNMGTSVVNGEARAIVSAIGRSTSFGKIAEKLKHDKPVSEFERGIRDFGMLVMKLTTVLVIFIFGLNLVMDREILSSVLFALALAVGLTPELLPVIVTINLSKGAMRMSAKGVVVKHLPAIQNMGSIEILCTDKTGTITENKIKLEKYENIDGEEDLDVLSCAHLNSSYQTNLKSPMDDAILMHNVPTGGRHKKIDEIPFDFERRRLSVVLEKDGETTMYTKGAPENMWHLYRGYFQNGRVRPMTLKALEKMKKRFERLSREGFRVLAVASKEISDDRKVFSAKDENHLVFYGFTAFLDPPKKDADELVGELASAGVDLKILTGDNGDVTKRILVQIGVEVKGILTGKQIDKMDEDELREKALKANIFARLNPFQKERIIKNLRSGGKVVGYMGDGVNDAISLKAADVGISVSNAADVSREAADIILVNKSLEVLQDGIREGRVTIANAMKYIFMGTGSNFGNMFSVAAASLFLPFLPMLPIQIILNNLIYDLSQLSLPSDNVDPEDIAKPIKWDMGFIRKFVLEFGPISSIFDIATYVFLFFGLKVSMEVFRTGWFVESLATQSLIILLIRTKRVPFFRSRPSISTVLTSVMAVLVGIVITQSSLGLAFEFTPLPPIFWAFLLGVLVLYAFLVEAVKVGFYRKKSL